MSKLLVAYFSASGVTENVAKSLAKVSGAELYEIKPKVKYTKADLNWMDKKSRSSVEMNNKAFRPEIITDDIDVSPYNVILLGFPIWWYTAPTIINTFLEHYDFSDKKIILFATSGSSGFGKTADDLKLSAKGAVIEAGKILNGNPSDDEIKQWLSDIGMIN